MKKLTLVATCMAWALSAAVSAQDHDPENMEAQAEELAANATAQEYDTVLDNKDLAGIIKQGEMKDEIRSQTGIITLKNTSESERISYLKNLRQATVQEFIVNNVPAHILAAGDNEVELYIRQHFIENNPNDTRPSKQVLWNSDSTPLTRDDVRPIWEDTTPEPVANTVITEPAEKQDEQEVLPPGAIEEKDALAALGMTQEDLDRYLGKSPETVKPAPADIETNVHIKSIDVDRVVLLGKRSYVNATLSFMVKKGDQNRAVEKRYQEVMEGFSFDIDGVSFELIEINPNVVAFQNIKDGTTHRALVQ